MGSLSLPSIASVAIATVKEILAFTALPYYQVSGNLTAAETAVAPGDPIAWDATNKKWINYAQGGSGDETTCVGIVRIGCSAAAIAAGDCPIEVVVGGAVKYSVIIAGTAYHAAVLTDLKGRYIEAADAFIF